MKRRKKDAIDHLDDIDVFIESRGMTKEDEAIVSEYIRKHKAKSASKSKRKRAA